MPVHIPDVVRVSSDLLITMQRLERDLAEFRNLAVKNEMPRDVAHEVFFRAELDRHFTAHLAQLRVQLEARDRLFNEITESNARGTKRGKKFQHEVRMLTQLTEKIHRRYGKALQAQGPLWTDVTE
jgi:hypothetical protein